MPGTYRLRAVLSAGAVLALALGAGAACSSGGERTGDGGAGGRQNPNAAPTDLMRQIDCFRTHGMPDWPDPNYDARDGRWHLDGPPLTDEARQACADVMPKATPPSAAPSAQLHQLLDYARCMRTNGVPDWPDPGVDGVFLTNRDLKSDPAIQSAAQTCEHFLAGLGGTIEIRPSGA